MFFSARSLSETTSPLLTEVGGVYLKDDDISPLDDDARALTPENIPAEVMSHSIDPQSARRRWELNERLRENRIR